MITEGQYSQLYLLLNQYQTGQLSDKYDEFILRFKIIYNAYCNRSELNNYITQYASLPCMDGIDELMELFIVLQMKQELQQLVSFCKNPDLIRFATIIIEGREETDLSLPKIGKIFGNRHYSTVIHAVEKIEEQLKYDEILYENVETIRAKLQSRKR